MHIAVMAVAASQILYQMANCRGRFPVTLSAHFGSFALAVSLTLHLFRRLFSIGGGYLRLGQYTTQEAESLDVDHKYFAGQI